MLCGSYHAVEAASEETQTLLDHQKGAIEAKAGRTFDSFLATKVAKQIVSGTNYKIKVSIGGSEYIHVVLYQQLSGEVTVTSVEVGKTEADAL